MNEKGKDLVKTAFSIFIVFMFIVIATSMATGIIQAITVDKDAKARCESVHGELGGKKCFKDGKEV